MKITVEEFLALWKHVDHEGKKDALDDEDYEIWLAADDACDAILERKPKLRDKLPR